MTTLVTNVTVLTSVMKVAIDFLVTAFTTVTSVHCLLWLHIRSRSVSLCTHFMPFFSQFIYCINFVQFKIQLREVGICYNGILLCVKVYRVTSFNKVTISATCVKSNNKNIDVTKV